MKSPIDYLKVSVTMDPQGNWDAVLDTELDTVVIQTILRKIILDLQYHGNRARIVNQRRAGDKV